jgi:hypothetical protein
LRFVFWKSAEHKVELKEACIYTKNRPLRYCVAAMVVVSSLDLICLPNYLDSIPKKLIKFHLNWTIQLVYHRDHGIIATKFYHYDIAVCVYFIYTTVLLLKVNNF